MTLPNSLANIVISDVLMSLGNFDFSMSKTSYDKLSRSVSFDWQEKKRIGNYPDFQYISKSETIDLQGTVYASISGKNPFSALEKEAEKPLLLVSGTGEVFGEWILDSLKEDKSVFYSDGTARRIAFSMTLKKTKDIVSEQLSSRFGVNFG